ncbi:hypothetical protein PR202_gb10587 [Eleusine coracana subsp. coracana]|uniref:procollagen-proline 4-dioxygenase n=1 Tax=Eleusine coracana subsp. coracana TaxID=191504 RepID=A0AAV5EK60_ELECO|nr:hypothetical protein PR202_gb10587 [Eleusine coracana subsp. coracana]
MAPPLVVLLLTTSLALALCPVHSHGAAFSNPARVTQLSWSPRQRLSRRAFLYSGFLSDSECDHLVQLAKGRLEKTTVVDINSGESLMSQARTSTGTFLAKRQDEIVAGIEKRVAAWTFLPEENAEAMQILRYEIGQKYDAHYDYFRDKLNLRLGGHRIATVLMYLTDVKSGGETVFPDAMASGDELLAGRPLTTQGRNLVGLCKSRPGSPFCIVIVFNKVVLSPPAVKPRKGDALLFFGLHLNATTDPSSLHGSCPVIEGEKWSATKWIHVRSFDNPPTVKMDAACSDDNDLCPRWAEMGECYNNPTYMVGNDNTLGYCRKSCGVCDS